MNAERIRKELLEDIAQDKALVAYAENQVEAAMHWLEKMKHWLAADEAKLAALKEKP